MASPLNKLQTSFRQGTQLGRTSLEEASARAGQPVRPTTPMGAAGLGVGADSLKMAGSSANVAAAQRQALQPSETERLQDVLRRRTLAREETAEERAKRGQAAGLQGLSSLQTRVQELADAMYNAAAMAPGATVVFTVDSKKLADKTRNLTTAQVDSLKTIIEAYAAGNATSTQLNEAATILNITDENELKSKLREFITDVGTRIGEEAGKAIGNEALITEDALAKMGMSSQQVGGILGIPPAQVLTMTTYDLVNRIDTLKQSEFSRVDALRRIVADPNVGAAERQAAQEQLIGMGYAGVTAAEASVQRLSDEIEDANTITIGGKTVSVSEALSDPFISKLISDYIKDPTGPVAQEIDSKYPGLKAFILANKDALAATATAMDEDINNFIEIQADAAALRNGPAGTQLNDQASQDLGISVTGLVDAVPLGPPIVNYLNNADPTTDTNASTVLTNINNIAAIGGAADFGGVMAGIRTATEAELRSSGFIDDSDEYYNYVKTITALNYASANSQESVLDAIFGDNLDIKGLEEQIKQARNYQRAGLLAEVDPLVDILDADNDGKLDSADKIKAAFLNKMSQNGEPMTIQEILAANQTVKGLNKVVTDLVAGKTNIKNSNEGPQGSFLNKFGKYFSDGTGLDAKEMEEIKADAAISLTELERLLTIEPQNTGLKNLIESRRDESINKLFDGDADGGLTVTAQYSQPGESTTTNLFGVRNLWRDGTLPNIGVGDWKGSVRSVWAKNARYFIPALDKFKQKWDAIKEDRSIPDSVKTEFKRRYDLLKTTVKEHYDTFVEKMVSARTTDVNNKIKYWENIAKQEKPGSGAYKRAYDNLNSLRAMTSDDIRNEVMNDPAVRTNRSRFD